VEAFAGLIYLGNPLLVGGFNPFEKYESKWVHLPQIGVNIKQMFEATVSLCLRAQ